MLFWKDTFAASAELADVKELGDSQWTSWPRPSGGFLDLGCVCLRHYLFFSVLIILFAAVAMAC